MICLPEAIGTMDLLATKLERYCILAWSLACSFRTLSSHDIGFEGLNGEHGLNTWKTSRVEPWSWVSHLGVSPWTREKSRKRSKGESESVVFMAIDVVGFWCLSLESSLLYIYIYIYIVKGKLVKGKKKTK